MSLNSPRRATAADASGTSLIGYLAATYDELVERFGAPNFGPNALSSDGKVTCEWVLKFGLTVVTIYDYKERKTPFYRYEWHVGSHRPFVKIVRLIPEITAV